MMSLQRCEQGHFYNKAKHNSCPHCGVIALNISPSHTSSEDLHREIIRPLSQPMDPQAGATVALIRQQTGIDPAVAWLVCVQGKDKGQDYRIRSDRNFIGRDSSMDICIRGDETISREKHAVISYNPKKYHFRLAPGDGHNNIYLNDEVVDMSVLLAAYDVLEMGQSKFVFVPLCGEQFHW